MVFLQGFAKLYGGEGRVGGGEGCAREGVRLPFLSLTIYRGKGGGGGALGFPRGGAAATWETLDGFGRPHPWETCPPSREGWLP